MVLPQKAEPGATAKTKGGFLLISRHILTYEKNLHPCFFGT